jgi:hypothetical protein
LPAAIAQLLYQDDFVFAYLLYSQMNLDQRIIVGPKLSDHDSTELLELTIG